MINYIVDPFGINNKIKKAGFNKYKAIVDERITKYENMLKNKYEVYIFGSSKTTVIRPEYIEERTGLSAYNASFSSATVDEYYKYIKYIVENNNNVKKILIGIDLFAFGEDFRSNGQMPEAFSPSSTTSNLSKYLSFDSLKRSYEVIIFNMNNQSPDLTFSDSGVRIYNGYLSAKKSGGDVLKKYIEKNVIGTKVNWHSINKISSKRISKLKNITKILESKSIDFVVFTNPLYRDYTVDPSIPEYKLYIELLKRIVSKGIRVLDFSHEFDFNDVPVNFIDKAHYNYEIGDKMIDKIFLESVNYGRWIDRANIDSLPPVRNNNRL